MGEWISVDELRPQVDFEVIVCVDDDVEMAIYREYPDGSWYFDNVPGVTHWMPLPEPPHNP